MSAESLVANGMFASIMLNEYNNRSKPCTLPV